MKQVYIADDNTEFAEYLAIVARQDNWDAKVCANGFELLDQLLQNSGFALLFIDIDMPVLDGIEVIEGIVDQDRPVRVYFMTGGDDPPMIAAKMIAKARDLRVGMNIYKPLRKEAFITILRRESEILTGTHDTNF